MGELPCGICGSDTVWHCLACWLGGRTCPVCTSAACRTTHESLPAHKAPERELTRRHPWLLVSSPWTRRGALALVAALVVLWHVEQFGVPVLLLGHWVQILPFMVLTGLAWVAAFHSETPGERVKRRAELRRRMYGMPAAGGHG